MTLAVTRTLLAEQGRRLVVVTPTLKAAKVASAEVGARLRAGDLLVVHEAGMLDQDTARALLTIADECRVHVVLLGDRHQLAAVGRGGVLDLAAAAVDPAGHLALVGVHRFTRTDATGRTTPDRLRRADPGDARR